MVKFNASTYAGYSTSVIGNTSLAWIKEQAEKKTPFMAYVAVKAPHIQDGPGWPVAIPPPWYTEAFEGVTAPRTPNWNVTGHGHHWLVRSQPPLTDEQAQRSDALYVSRWRALLAVDDIVTALCDTLQAAGQLSNTYILYTSDHGFQFGQFRMPEGKWNVYEHDIRIPMVIAGPGVTPNSTFSAMGTNVDVAPTILSLAGVAVPDTMDGRSVAHHVVNADAPNVPRMTRRQLKAATQQTRTHVLVEYIGLGDVVRYQHLEDAFNNTFRAIRAVDRTKGGLGNVLYAEFTDAQTNYNWTHPAQERELYDLDTDPFQLNNLWPPSPERAAQLGRALDDAYRCRGTDCP
mmetsp:Transcript_17006/g.36869  ORF Transcript_17006/g.36869 Transcript_17006/m.36869 type:complete len:346 (+) Transcript_17006:1-1038(+)